MKKSHVNLIVIIVLVAIGAIGGTFAYLNSDTYKAKQLYDALTADYTVADCDLIISLYPTTKYAELASEKKQLYYAKIERWKGLCKNPTAAGFKSFKEDFNLTDHQIAEVDKKIDSILWHNVKLELTEQAFKDYISNSPNAHHNSMAHDVVRRMDEELADVSTKQADLEATLRTFLKGYGVSNSAVYMPTLADTVDLFLFRSDIPKAEVDKYIKQRVNSKGKQFDYEIISDLKFSKSRMLLRGVGYGVNFKLKQTLRNNKTTTIYFAKVIFNPEGKIAYIRLRKDYAKHPTTTKPLKK